MYLSWKDTPECVYTINLGVLKDCRVDNWIWTVSLGRTQPISRLVTREMDFESIQERPADSRGLHSVVTENI